MPEPRNLLTQERIMTIITAAESILSAYDALLNQLDIFRKANEQTIPLDLLYETAAKHGPPRDAIILIALEKTHFKARWKSNQRARRSMQRLYNKRRGRDPDYNSDSDNEPFPQPPELPASPKPTKLFEPLNLELAAPATVSTEIPQTLRDWHDFLRRAFGAIPVFKADIRNTLQELWPSMTDDQILKLLNDLLNTIPDGADQQFLTQMQFDRVMINDI